MGRRAVGCRDRLFALDTLMHMALCVGSRAYGGSIAEGRDVQGEVTEKAGIKSLLMQTSLSPGQRE